MHTYTPYTHMPTGSYILIHPMVQQFVLTQGLWIHSIHIICAAITVKMYYVPSKFHQRGKHLSRCEPD